MSTAIHDQTVKMKAEKKDTKFFVALCNKLLIKLTVLQHSGYLLRMET